MSDVVAESHRRTRGDGSDFDIGLMLNGASVNQLLRALTAGKRAPNPTGQMVDIGILDAYEASGTYEVHPSVAPLYLPTVPAGWQSPSNVNLYVPSLRVTLPKNGGASFASDLRLGVDAFTDANTLVPYLKRADVAPRFLRLDKSINQAPEGDLGLVAAIIRAEMPPKVAAGLGAINANQINQLGGPPMHLRNLSLQTVGGGHLGVFVDVETTPAQSPNPVSVTWDGSGPGGAPVAAKLEVRTDTIPGITPYQLRWTIRHFQNGPVVYESPVGGEPAIGGVVPMSKTIDATALEVVTDPCTGGHSATLFFEVAITRGGYTKNVSRYEQYTWPGTPPDPVPRSCNEPEPPPEPEPEPEPPISPICEAKPWLCEDL